jgi:hypothetical protein
MKRVLSVLLVAVMLATFAASVFANDISLYNNNTGTTATNFVISSTGLAMVAYKYSGYTGITTGATIEIKIQKRNLLIFWSDIVTETISATGELCDEVYTYQLSGKGTYKCTVTYTVYGTAGEADVIPFERTVTYS